MSWTCASAERSPFTLSKFDKVNRKDKPQMKTIIVVYTDIKLSKADWQTMKRYSFNTRSKVRIGDMIEGDRYSTAMQVIEILDTTYKYVNVGTGELSNKKAANTKQYEIRELRVNDDKSNGNVVECTRLDGEDD